MHRISVLTRQGRSTSLVVSGKGPLLMLLHGFPLDHRLWLNQLEDLSGRYQVVCPEFRGFGDSTGWEDGYSLADLAEDVEVVRSHFSPTDKMSLAGLSMGGYVAFEYWSKYSRHLDRLLLVNTKPQADEESAAQGRLQMAKRVKAEGTEVVVAGMVDKLISPAASDQVRLAAQAMMLSTSPDAIAAAQVAMSKRRDFEQDLSKLDVPTLVITGRDDPLCPPDKTTLWAQQIPNCRFEVISHAGHLSPLEQPSAFNRLLNEFVSVEPA